VRRQCSWASGECDNPVIGCIEYLDKRKTTFYYCAEHYDWVAKMHVRSARDTGHPFQDEHAEMCRKHGWA